MRARRRRRRILLATVALLAACGSRDRIGDPIDGIALTRQQTISRSQLGFRWPLSAGTGTLACADDGVILFRTGGVTYLVHGARGGRNISALRVAEPSPPPSDPVKRVTQNVRMDAFASLERCRATGREEACRKVAQDRFGLSAEERRLIEAEGRERRWPPLERGLMSLDPLVAAGRALCSR